MWTRVAQPAVGLQNMQQQQAARPMLSSSIAELSSWQGGSRQQSRGLPAGPSWQLHR